MTCNTGFAFPSKTCLGKAQLLCQAPLHTNIAQPSVSSRFSSRQLASGQVTKRSRVCAARRFVELGPARQTLARPALLELPHCAATRGREREVVALRSDDGVQWSVHQGDASDLAVLDALSGTFAGTYGTRARTRPDPCTLLYCIVLYCVLYVVQLYVTTRTLHL